MAPRLIFLSCVAACLYVPSFTSEWGHYQGVFLAYGGMPLAIASAAHAAVGVDLVTQRGAAFLLAGFWAVGCLVTCVPTLGIADPVVQARVSGGALVLVSAGLLIAAVRGVFLDGQTTGIVKGAYGSAIVVFAGVFLWQGLLIISSASGGEFAAGVRKEEAFRIAVLAGAALVVVAGVLSQVGRRRPTRA
jgi:hypothetical protein